MRAGVVIAGVVAVVISTAAVVMLVSPRKLQNPKGEPIPETTMPPVSRNGPWPKAVMDETDYEFGRMEIGDEQSHVFTIRNEGDAPLVITKGPTTCQCTLGTVEKGLLAVGEATTITLKWKPTAHAEQFGKGADIYTNDPNKTRIHLRILGMVVPQLVTSPEGTWASPEVLEGQPTAFTGKIVSPIADSFQIVALESQNPVMSAESLPAEKSELEASRGRSGYQIRVSIRPDVPVGVFALPLKIKTDLPTRNSDGTQGAGSEIVVLVTGRRGGPIRFIGGQEWDENSMAVVLGSFDAKVGKKVAVTMFVRGDGAEEFHLTEPPICDPEALRVTLTRDEKSKGRQARFLLSVEYPAGAVPATRRTDSPGKITLQTNLPSAPKIELLVFLRAQ